MKNPKDIISATKNDADVSQNSGIADGAALVVPARRRVLAGMLGAATMLSTTKAFSAAAAAGDAAQAAQNLAGLGRVDVHAHYLTETYRKEAAADGFKRALAWFKAHGVA